MDHELINSYLAVFDTPQGQTVLDDLERQANKVQVDRRPNSEYPNDAYLNPYAGLYKVALLEQIARIRGIILKAKKENQNHGNINQEVYRRIRAGTEEPGS